MLNGATQTFNTTFALSGLDVNVADTLIDLWRVDNEPVNSVLVFRLLQKMKEDLEVTIASEDYHEAVFLKDTIIEMKSSLFEL